MVDYKDYIPQTMGSDEDVYAFLIANPTIRKMINRGDLTTEQLRMFPIDCLDFIEDHQICKDCTGLFSCPKSSKGFQTQLIKTEEGLDRQLVKCHYLKKVEENSLSSKYLVYRNVPESFFKYQFEDLASQLKEDVKIWAVLKEMHEFRKNYPHQYKGLFIGGEKGFIQSQIAAAFTRLLVLKQIPTAYISFPEYVTQLKRYMNTYDKYYELVDVVKNAPVLIIDDIGNESTISAWSRDEVLGSILSYRMNQQLPTFITSMYTINELFGLYQTGQASDLKARVLIERIKSLGKIYEL